MVVIRLSRGGANKRPFYHVVVTDHRNRRDGRYIERIGYFNPLARGGEKRIELNLDRIDHWESVGAQVSQRVSQIVKDLKKHGTAGKSPEAEEKKIQKKAAKAAAKKTVTATEETPETTPSE